MARSLFGGSSRNLALDISNSSVSNMNYDHEDASEFSGQDSIQQIPEDPMHASEDHEELMEEPDLEVDAVEAP